MLRDLYRMVRLAYTSGGMSGDVRRGPSARGGVSVPETLLGRGNLAVASGRISTGREMRQMKKRVLEHDFRG